MLTLIVIISGIIAVFDGEETVLGLLEALGFALILDGMTVVLAYSFYNQLISVD